MQKLYKSKICCYSLEWNQGCGNGY